MAAPIILVLVIILFTIFFSWFGRYISVHISPPDFSITEIYDYMKMHGYELESEKLPTRLLLEKSTDIADQRTLMQRFYSTRRLKPILVYCITDKVHKIIWIEIIFKWGSFNSRVNKVLNYIIETNPELMHIVEGEHQKSSS